MFFQNEIGPNNGFDPVMCHVFLVLISLLQQRWQIQVKINMGVEYSEKVLNLELK